MPRPLIPILLLGIAAAVGTFIYRPAPAAPAPAAPAPPAPVLEASPEGPAPTTPGRPGPADAPDPLSPPDAPDNNPGLRTVIEDNIVVDKLLGEHPLSLQWISWRKFGRVTVENDGGLYRLKGKQAHRGDYVTLDGVIAKVTNKSFVFDGTLVTRVSHINRGKPCPRQGEMTFRITSNRKYWRLKQMENPCDGTPRLLDYVDIYFPQLDAD